MTSKHLNVGRGATPTQRMSYCALIVATFAVIFSADLGAQQQETPRLIGGRNVNMAGGLQRLSLNPYEVRGDVLGRSQNEPSCAISTRNPQHILCGSNDYRMVDVPGVTETQLIRDAWLGLFQSADGGDTWESTLYGGFFLDPAAHPLKTLRFQAAADPVVRSGLAGATFYTGIAFTADKSRSALHVSTYLDLNNSESDRMPFKTIRTTVVHQVRSPQFIDKPWMYVEAGPEGQTCTLPVPGLPNQVVPASTVHVVYTVFLDLNDSTAAIMYTRSTNCGLSFSTPVRLNPTATASIGLNDHGNGASIAKPLNSSSQTVVVTWRRVRQTVSGNLIPDAILSSVSTNNGLTWTAPFVVEQICPFDQGTTATSFRTTSFPSLTADGSGRFYVAWSDRRQPDGTCATTPANSAPIGAARIRVATSTNGQAWSSSIAVPSDTPEHQIQPSLVFTAGRLFLAWMDFRSDASQVFGQFVNEAEVLLNTPKIRHTADVRASMALPGSTPEFASGATQISEYLKGVVTIGGKRVVGQLQWNAVNRRWARKGTVPFYGDYLDIATMPYLPPDPAVGRTTWTPNNSATIATPLGPVPFMPNLLVAWSDNRDMRAAPGVDNDPAVAVPYSTPAGLSLPATSVYDPTQNRPVCTVPQEAYKTGTLNQNAYSARLSVGFLAVAPGNHKRLGAVQRAFVIFVRNDGNAVKSFRLLTTPPPGGFASFDQFDPAQLTLDVNVPARSSVARTVFVTRNTASPTPLSPDAPIRVDVIELQGVTPVNAATVMLNGDASAPEIDNPEIDNREVFTPEIDNPEIDNRGFASPEIDNPEIDNPEIDNATWRALGLGTPEIDNPEIDNPEIDNAEILSPEIDNPEIDNAAITDARFLVTNTGNTLGQYNAKAFVTPSPGSDFRYQIIVRKTYNLPAVDSQCQPTTITVSKVAVNLPDVQLGTPEIDNPEIDNPEIDNSAPTTASFFLGPDESAEVIVRVRSVKGLTLPAEAFDLATQPEAVNSQDAVQGITEAPIVTTYLSIGTTAVPAARTGVAYDTLLFASGGTDPLTFTLTAGQLPPGLVLTGAGQIAGTPTAAGSFSFTVQAADSSFPVQTVTRSFTIPVTTAGTATLAFITQPTTTLVGGVITPFPSVRAVTAAGAPAVGVNVTVQLVGGGGLAGTLTRATNANGVAVFDDLAVKALTSGLTLTATATGFAPAASGTFTTVLPGNSTLAFNVQPSNASVGNVMTPAVEVRALDPGGASVPGIPVTLQLLGNGTLTGTVTRTTAGTGVATFNDLVLTTTGTGLAFQATATGFVSVTSTTFDAVTTNLQSPVANSGVMSEPLMSRPVQGLGGDANRDLVVIHSNGLITSMGGDGNGQFTRMFQSSTIGNSGTPRDVRAGAVDGDGYPDLVIAYDGADTNNLQIASTNGNFDWTSALNVLSVPGIPSGAVIAQLNAAVDAAPDIAVLSRTTNQLFISEVNRNFVFRVPLALPGTEPIAIASGQMNPGTDPWTDLVVLNRGSRNVTVLLGNGQGGFTVAGNFPLGATGLRTPSDSADALALADFNEDGSLDVGIATDAVAAEEGQAVIVLLGNGAGSLGTGTRHALSAGPLSLTTADFNNDGHIDIATANPAQNNITILHGTGTGTFASPQAMSAGNTPRGVVAADFTNDGKPEIVVTNQFQRPTTLVDEVTTILNVASGTGALTVTSTADGGPGSLRAALTTANARAGLDEVSFAIPGAGPHVIALNTPLPHITDPIVIDGTTQPGYAGSPQVEIDGSAAGLDADGLWIANGNSEIVGLSLTGFLPGPMNVGGSAIVLAAPAGGSWVRSNYIGLHPSGTVGGTPTVGWGVTSGGANAIGAAGSGRNIISGTSFTGVLLGGSGAIVMYNRFGTTPDGLSSAMPGQPQGTGVSVRGSTMQVWRNVIANQGGIFITSDGTNVTVQGNYIGTDANGTTVLANPNFNSTGILVDGSNNLIGGSTSAEGNVIGGYGTGVFTRFGTGVSILNNRIGLGADGVANLPNQVWGVGLASGGNTVQNNTITASSQAGIMLSGPTAQDNLITNNAIDQNPGAGIGLLPTAGSRNNLVPNIFSLNGGLAIDLNYGDGPTANDAGDADAGPNNLQNFPVITGAVLSTGSVTVSGFLNSTPSSTFILHVFQNTGICPAFGRGEGQVLLGSFAVITDANGNATFSTGLIGNVPAGAFLSATATDATGSTSEFSSCFFIPVTPVAASLAFASQPAGAVVGQTITPAVTVLATDTAGQPVSSVPVTLVLKGTGTLSGTLTRVTGSNGVATFDDLSVNAAGTGNTLVASALGFASAASAPFAITTAAAPPVSNGLVSWWRAENNAVDSIGTNNGTLVNGATFGAGQFGQAFQLDGNDDFVDVGAGFNLDALTLSAWVRVDSSTNTGERRIISKDNFDLPGARKAFALKSSSNNLPGPNGRPTFEVCVSNAGNQCFIGNAQLNVISAPSPLSAGWHHLVGVRDTAGRFELYVDGALVSSSTPTAIGAINSAVNTVIGTVSPSSAGEFFNGLIDEPQIFNRALSATEIAALFHHQSLVVTNTNDSGTGSLRDAMLATNAIAGPQVPHITFDIAGTGPHTIAPTSPLPTMTRPVVIDATTQPGYTGAPVVGINGSSAGLSANGLSLTGGSSLIRGLQIAAFDGHGIFIQGPGSNRIAGNYIGVTFAGDAPIDDGNGDAIRIQDSSGNVIGGNVGTTPGGPCTGDCNVIVGRHASADVAAVFIYGGASSASTTAVGNQVLGNFIGTNAAGTVGMSSLNSYGVYALHALGTIVGDGTPAGRNVISGNNTGLILASNNVSVRGNYVGTTADGTAAILNPFSSPNNGNGGVILNGNDGLIEGNLVSGNGNGGATAIHVINANSNTFRGNTIGLNALGTAAIPNGIGIYLGPDTAGNTVGGTTAAARNIISGNLNHGVMLQTATASNNTVLGNFIGTNAGGTTAVGNGAAGVLVEGATNTIIGGTAAGQGNVISGNVDGVSVTLGSIGTVIQGNIVGLDATGTAAVGNTATGVRTANAGFQVGGTTPGARNIISANQYGVLFSNSGSTFTSIVQGNYIGTDITGTIAFGNTQQGVSIGSAPGTVVGGSTPGAGNLISGNNAGIFIGALTGAAIDGTYNAVVQGNIIGLNAAGTAALGNSNGIVIGSVVAPGTGNLIGGTTAGMRNVISGNVGDGVSISGDTARNNVIQGNYIGTDVTGTLDRGNGLNGVAILVSSNNIVGGVAPGAGNVLSGNGEDGVSIGGGQSVGNVVQGNLIGTDVTGAVAIGNGLRGVSTNGVNTVIGGTSPAARNVISGNQIGIRLGFTVGQKSTLATVQGNYIGTDVTGTVALGQQWGIFVNGADDNVIGGTVPAARNVIAGSSIRGISLHNVAAARNQIRGNFIGTNATGTGPLPNAIGIGIEAGSTDTIVGGTDAGSRNLISGNTGQGVYIAGATTTANVVAGNYIGTDVTGALALANGGTGVHVVDSPGNLIGGSTPAAGNVISRNNGSGVLIQGTGTGNAILANSIFNNGALGINLGLDGSTPNDTLDADSGPNNFQNYPAITGATTTTVSGTLHSTANTSFTIHVYVNNTCDPSGFGEGQQLLDTRIATTNAAGDADISFGSSGLSLTLGQFVTATATDPSGNTSEFSACRVVAVPAVFAVTNSNDSGPGSLRQALLDANANTDTSTINFNIPGTGPFTIQPTSALPTVISPIVLDGRTQPGYAGTPIVGINGAGSGVAANGLHLTGGSSVVRGLQIAAFDGHGILIEGPGGNRIAGNYIGVTFAGDAPIDDGGGDGIRIQESSANIIGGTAGTTPGGPCTGDCNVIVGRSPNPTTVSAIGIYGGVGVDSTTATGNQVLGNFIGTNAAGTVGMNSLHAYGLYAFHAHGTIVGDGTPAGRNVISGTNTGMFLTSNAVSVRGNYVGTTADGNAAMLNPFAGINNVNGGLILNGDDGLIDGNLVSGNGGGGATAIFVVNANRNTIRGNSIGLNALGTLALPNDIGVWFGSGTSNNVLGGSTAGDRNVISGNSRDGVLLQTADATNNSVRGNYIGTNPAGTAAIANTTNGITIDGAPANIIGGTGPGEGNLVSGNNRSGIVIQGAAAIGNLVQGNYVGTNAAGTAAIGTPPDVLNVGVMVFNGVQNTIGGTATGARNVVSGYDYGVLITGASAAGNVVQGNFIGTNATGTAAVPNSIGASIQDASNNTIGGTVSGARNVISGNAGTGANYGVYLSGPATANLIQGNYIGTDVSGALPLPNEQGIAILGSQNNIIGGTAGGAGNLISGNLGNGIYLLASATGTLIQGNIIGLDASGVGTLGNLNGVAIYSGATLNTVGGSAAARNTIAGNSGRGVLVDGATTTGNAILANSIFNNGDLGIDLGFDGPTPNDDALDVDSGPNNLQNYPVITAATPTSVSGTLHNTPNTSFTIHIYVNNTCDPSGFGEGQQLLGSLLVTSNGAGNLSFTLDGLTLTAGQSVTATATDPGLNTSEFSACVGVTNQPVVTVVASDASANEAGPDGGSFTITRTGPTTSPLNVNFSVGGTATPIVEYTNSLGILATIPAGQSSVIISFTPVLDDIVEDNETVIVTLTPGDYVTGDPSTATVTIIENTPTVTVTASDASANEAGPDPGSFTFTRTGPTVAPLNVTFNLYGAATAGVDYVNTIGTLVTIPVGQSSATVSFTPLADALFEGPEDVTVTIVPGTYVIGTPDTAMVTIADATVPFVDLSLGLSDSPDPVLAGSNVVYTFAVTNNGTLPATNVTLTGPVGLGLTFVSGSGACALGTPCNLGTLAPGGSTGINITMRADEPGAITATGSVSSTETDSNPADNTDTTATTVNPNVGQITGTVRSAAGAPLAGVNVQIVDPLGDIVHNTTTNAAGIYLTEELPKSLVPGLQLAYYVRVINVPGFGNATYGCPNVSCNVQFGTPIVLAGNGATTTGIDFNLVPFGSISGTATAGGASVNGSTILVFNADDPGNSYPLVANTSAAANGTYTVSVAPGRYYVRSLGGLLINGTVASPQFYSAVNCVGCLPSDGSMVVVSPGATTAGINFTHAAVGGRITGTITDAATGTPLSGVTVLIFTATGEVLQTLNTNGSGVYGSTGLPNGQYFVRTANRSSSSVGPAFNFPYIDELYGNIPCALGCAITTGTPVAVNGANVTGIDIALSRGGQITGTLTDATNGESIGNALVHIFRANGQFAGFATTDGSGVYFSTGLPDGTYYLKTSVTGEDPFIDALYGGQPCLTLFQASGPACDVKTGTPVVIAGANASGINFPLNYGALIAGRVTNEATGAPLASIAQTGNFRGIKASVGVYDAAGRVIAVTPTDQDGRYMIRRALPPGTYFARTFTFDVTIDEAHGNVPCLGEVCDVLSSTPIVVTPVTAGNFVKTVDFALAVGGAIESTIVSATGAPTSATLEVYNAAGQLVSLSLPPAAGVAVSRGLPPGNYFAKTSDTHMLHQPFSINGSVAHEIYDNSPCPPGCAVTTGTPIALTTNTTTPITVALNRSLGRITGYVIDASTGTLLNFLPVEIYNSTGTLLATAMTRNLVTGYFVSPGLPAGNYYLRTRNTLGYPDVLYNGGECEGECNVTLGTPVTVTNGQPTAGIVLALGGTPKPIISISSSDNSAAETGPDPGTFNVTRTGSLSSPLVVQYAVSGTATNGVDYVTLSGSVTIPGGQASATFSVTPIDDLLPELAETVIVTLSSNAAYIVGSSGAATVTIASDASDTALVVTNTNDSGTGSLRQAILDANAAPDLSTILFDIPGPGPYTIQPATALSTVTAPIVIDGTSQHGFSGSPIIELNGQSAGSASGLSIVSGGSTVRGLVINRFSSAGLRFTTGGSNLVEGNFIGTDVTGAAALGNGANGIAVVNSPNNVIGGFTATSRNVVSGNTNTGVLINGPESIGNQIRGNFIGTNAAGTAALPNTNAGVEVVGSANSTIGGESVNARNLISGGAINGVLLRSGSSGNVVQNNWIGVTAAGTTALANGGVGVIIRESSSNNTVRDNLISGNVGGGILVNIGATGNIIRGNRVGTDPSGTSAIANTGPGIQISDPGSNGNVIGGSTAAEGNVIAFNTGAGVQSSTATSINNRIQSNSIFSNGGLGIDLGTAGILINDSGDTDTGTNNLQNHPLIINALTTAVSGRLNSTANTTFSVQLFANATCDSSSYGEGRLLLATLNVVTDARGDGVFAQGGLSIPAESVVTATATDPLGNTSEFSPCSLVGTGGAAFLSFVSTLTTTFAGQGIAPPVKVLALGASGLPALGVPVTLSLIGGTGNLSGTLSRTTGADGLAAFDDIFIDTIGNGKTLQAAATGYFSATSLPFNTVANTGQIAGTVTSSVSGALSSVQVQIVDRFGAVAGTATTAVNGSFTTATLPGGTYYARTTNAAGHANITYGCAVVACNVTQGTPISVGGGSITGGINFTLTALGTISGTATASAGVPRANSTIQVYNADTLSFSLTATAATALTAEDGTYNVAVAPGRYIVRSTGNGLIPQVYGAGPTCVGCFIGDGAVVTVTPGATVPNINFSHFAGGQISGTVTNATSGAPISGVIVQIHTATGEIVGSGFQTNASGIFNSAGLTDGQYFVKTSNTLGFIDELHGDIACPFGCAVTIGTPVTITGGASVAGVNIALTPGGRITGTVTDAATGAAITNGQVIVHRSNGQIVSTTILSGTGTYSSLTLPDGSYFVRTNITAPSSGYIDQLYAGQTCVYGMGNFGPLACDVTTGTPVAIAGGVDTTGTNFALSKGGQIAGRVTNELTGLPLPNTVQSSTSNTISIVGIYDAAGHFLIQASTDQDGRYLVQKGLPTGLYIAKTFTTGVTIDEVSGNVPCLGDTCDVLAGTPFSVTVGTITSSVDFALAAGGTIEATLVSASTGTPILGTTSVYTQSGQRVSTTGLPRTGFALSRGLPPGTYYAHSLDTGIQPFSNSGAVAHELYDNLPCAPGCSATAGTPITLTANTTVPITFALNRGLGRIVGYVTETSTGALLNGVSVEIYNAAGTLVATATSRNTSEGYFASTGLPAGTYYLRTRNTLGYQDVLYNGQPCTGSCNVLLGTPVTVVNGQPTAGIVLALGDGLPVVTISASDALADEVGGDPGTFTVTRTGNTTNQLVVHYTVSGTAANGIDYNPLPGSATIPAGQASTTLSVDPIDDAIQEATEAVVITLNADAAYMVGVPDQGVVFIQSDAADTFFEVINTNDSGPGSLRQAIIDANANPDLNFVLFTIPGPGPYTIQPLTPLPVITSPAYIAATTQLGYVDTPLVELSGALAGANASGLEISAGSSVVAGLAINRWSGPAIYMHGGGSNSVFSNYIGTDITGTVGLPNAGLGSIHVVDSPGNLINTNLISGNNSNGVRIDGATAAGTVVNFNQIGVTSAGTALGNQFAGIYVRKATGITIYSNQIRFNGSLGAISICGDVTACPGGDVGTPGSNASGTTIFSNVITNNVGGGIWINGAPSALIGTIGGGTNNISGNGFSASPGVPLPGILINGVGATDNQIVGNAINGNNAAGVLIVGGTNVRNRVQSNTLIDNGGLAIDLASATPTVFAADGVTPNDSGDGDTGPNNYQNFPILTEALGNGTVHGTLNSLPGATFTLDFYASTTCSAGDAERILGSFQVTTDANGNSTFTNTLASPPLVGEFVNATASDPSGNTSEFSGCVSATGSQVVLTFEEQADSIPVGTLFPTSYNGMTFTNWQHYAPYPGEFLPHGTNAIFAKADGATITFTDRVFVGASFSRWVGGPGPIFFELYQNGVLVHTSATLADTPPALTFLASGYTGLVDEVRVRSLGSTIVANGSTWVIDDITFQ